MFDALSIEQTAELYDPDNRDSFVCAICKSNVVRRIQGTRMVCELPGCLDVDIRFD